MFGSFVNIYINGTDIEDANLINTPSVKSTMKHLATICPILYEVGEFKKKHCDILRLT